MRDPLVDRWSNRIRANVENAVSRWA